MRNIAIAIAIVFAAALFSAGSASAQKTFPTENPGEAKPFAGSEIAKRLTGKAFQVTTVTSGNWRVQFDRLGCALVDTDNGCRDNGPRRVQGEQWCTNMGKTGDHCADLYAVGETLCYKRASNGEVVSMTLR